MKRGGIEATWVEQRAGEVWRTSRKNDGKKSGRETEVFDFAKGERGCAPFPLSKPPSPNNMENKREPRKIYLFNDLEAAEAHGDVELALLGLL